MSKKFYTFCIAIVSLLLPSYAFAQASILDNIDTSVFELSDLGADLIDSHGLTRSIGPGGGGGGGGGGSYGGGSYGGGSYSGGASMHIRSRRVYHHSNYNYYPPQPVLQYQPAPVVVYQQPSVIQPTETYAVGLSLETTFTMGLRAVGFYPGKLTSLTGEDLRFKTSGGIGFYSRFRPVRWIALEFITDVTFGKDEDCTSYFRMPVSLGLQFHIFDYGMLNVYGVAAASVTAIYTNSESIRDQYYQYGGQFGAGASVMLGGLELGLDVRYTIDTPPEAFNTLYGTFFPQNELQHGVVFAANLGLAF